MDSTAPHGQKGEHGYPPTYRHRQSSGVAEAGTLRGCHVLSLG